MYLYDKVLGKINVYELELDKEKLIEYKKKQLNDIKSIVLHIQERKIEDMLFWDNLICFSELDCKKEFNDKFYYNYMELINSDNTIERYINGDFDKHKIVNIKSDDLGEPAFYSRGLVNDDYTLLFNGGVETKHEFVSYESILLSGKLSYIQQFINGAIEKNNYLDDYLLDEDFIDIMRLNKKISISYEDLVYASLTGLITISDDIDKMLDNSYPILKLINRK